MEESVSLTFHQKREINSLPLFMEIRLCLLGMWHGYMCTGRQAHSRMPVCAYVYTGVQHVYRSM